MSIQTLPSDLLITIFTFIKPQESLLVAHVCKFWKECVNSEALWKYYCLQYPSMNHDLIESYKQRWINLNQWKKIDYPLANLLQNTLKIKKRSETELLPKHTGSSIKSVKPLDESNCFVICDKISTTTLEKWDLEKQTSVSLLRTTQIRILTFLTRPFILAQTDEAFQVWNIETEQLEETIKDLIPFQDIFMGQSSEDLFLTFNDCSKSTKSWSFLTKQTIEYPNTRLHLSGSICNGSIFIPRVETDSKDSSAKYFIEKYSPGSSNPARIFNLPYFVPLRHILLEESFEFLVIADLDIKIFEKTSEITTILHPMESIMGHAAVQKIKIISKFHLLSIHQDGQVHFWDLQSKACLHTFSLDLDLHHQKLSSFTIHKQTLFFANSNTVVCYSISNPNSVIRSIKKTVKKITQTTLKPLHRHTF